MKKFMMTLAMALTMTVAFAEGEENEKTNSIEAYSFNIDMTKLGSALRLSVDQWESVDFVQKQFTQEMMNAGASSQEERTHLMNKAISHDLTYMHNILNEEQYKTYVTILNATLKNRGLK